MCACVSYVCAVSYICSVYAVCVRVLASVRACVRACGGRGGSRAGSLGGEQQFTWRHTCPNPFPIPIGKGGLVDTQG